ncbi:MAG: GNAT family N-acetyltransferase [Microthrixaceae bacterium]
MTAPVATHAALPEHLPAILELLRQAHRDQREERGGDMWAQLHAAPLTRDRLRERMASGLVLVGTVLDCPVGIAVVRHEPLATGGRVALIEELYTEPQARGVGVGRHMMAAITAWAEATECQGIDALALPGDRSTKNFFEASGLVARAIIVHRPL